MFKDKVVLIAILVFIGIKIGENKSDNDTEK